MVRTVPPIRPIRVIGRVDPSTGEVFITPRFMRWLETQQNALTVIEDGDTISATTAVGTRYAVATDAGAVDAGRAATGYEEDGAGARAGTAYGAADIDQPAGTIYT